MNATTSCIYPAALDDVLAEARGYRLSLTLAHQHLGQLPRDLAEGIAANARNKIVFNVSPDDARTLGRHFGPRLTDRDLSRLGGWQAAARLVVNGRNTTGFTLATRPPLPPVGAQTQLRTAARQHGQSTAARRAAALQRRHPTGSTLTSPSSRPSSQAAVAGDGLGGALTDVLPDVFGDDLDTTPDPSPQQRPAAQHAGPLSTLGDDSDW